MKSLFLFLVVSLSAFGEAPQQWAGAGLIYNNGVGANGLFAYAHRLTNNETPTYSFTALRVTGWEGNPFDRATQFRLLTTQETGLAQYLKTFGGFRVYALGTFGSSQTVNPDGSGIAVGTSVTAGGMASKEIGRGWTLNPVVMWNKPSVAPTNQWSAGVLVGWGK